MILDYNHDPNLTVDQKLQSLMENIQLALNEKEDRGTQDSIETVREIETTIKRINEGLVIQEQGLIRLDQSLSLLEQDLGNLKTKVNDMDRVTDFSSQVTLTPTTGTVDGMNFKRYGKIIQCSIRVKNSAAITEQNNLFVGTISANARPQLFIQTPIYHGARIVIAGIASGGAVTFRVSKGTSEANAVYNAGFTFIALN